MSFTTGHQVILVGESPAAWPVTTGEMESYKNRRGREDIIAFYQDRKGAPWREFSNFYRQKGHGFDFVLPLQLLEIAGVSDTESFAPVVHCDYSEKAIMLCEAAVMGNAVYYKKIASADSPAECKSLGREITPWHQERWNSVVCGVAVAVLRQKFAVPALRDVLLSTGDKLLCEATAGDKVWAIGISIKMPKVYEVPARWKGSNVLGYALMKVRSILQQEKQGSDNRHD